ncbi:MAG: mRNA surveillance protein pelota [Thermoplasmata archaeon]|nr:MAG: mRNA surveillance protein pelota [Thermoplasmata archaeon]
MKIVFKDLKKGEIKIIPENPDDIWHLYNIIEEEDLVRAVTFRSDSQQKDGKIRSKKSEKKRVKLGIRVKKIGFHEFSDRLRVHGVIEEGPQDLGSYHTLNITADKMSKLSIIKRKWKKHQLDRIEEAVKKRNQPSLLFVSLDEATATIAILHQSGIQWITDIDSGRTGKMYESKNTEHEYYDEIISLIESYKEENAPLIVVGPGFAREKFVKHGRMKKPELFKKCITYGTGHSGMNGINEAIKSGVVEKIIRDNRVSFETQLVEKLFEEIKRDGMAVYGEEEVYDALNRGAVKQLLISDKVIRSGKGEEFIRLARQTNSVFTVINTQHDSGKKFEGIGGIGAFLRFKID